MKAIRLAGDTASEADIKGRVLVHDLGPGHGRGVRGQVSPALVGVEFQRRVRVEHGPVEGVGGLPVLPQAGMTPARPLVMVSTKVASSEP